MAKPSCRTLLTGAQFVNPCALHQLTERVHHRSTTDYVLFKWWTIFSAAATLFVYAQYVLIILYPSSVSFSKHMITVVWLVLGWWMILYLAVDIKIFEIPNIPIPRCTRFTHITTMAVLLLC